VVINRESDEGGNEHTSRSHDLALLIITSRLVTPNVVQFLHYANFIR
jgi:hypothetical protein